MKELIIKRLEKLESCGIFIDHLKDFFENTTNFLLASNRLAFEAQLISFEEYWDSYNLIIDFMSKHNLERRKIDV